MYKVIIEHFAWSSPKFDKWHRTISDLMLVNNVGGEWKREWPWPEKIDYLYTVSNRETIVLTFNSKKDWEDCKSNPEFSEVFDFESLDFFVYLTVSFAKKIISIGKCIEG